MAATLSVFVKIGSDDGERIPLGNIQRETLVDLFIDDFIKKHERLAKLYGEGHRLWHNDAKVPLDITLANCLSVATQPALIFILKTPVVVGGAGVPGGGARGDVAAAVPNVKFECDFSAASGTTLNFALLHLGLSIVPTLPPKNVKSVLFEAFPWPFKTVKKVKEWEPEPAVTPAVLAHANKLLKKAKVGKNLHDIRETISPLEVTFEAHGKHCRYAGYADLGLFTIPSPDPPVTGQVIGIIELTTPEKIAGYTPSHFASRALPMRLPCSKPVTLGTFKAIGIALYTGREGIPVLVTDFCTTGRIFVLEGESILDYRVIKGVHEVVMDAHTAWNVWLHLVEPVAVALKKLNARNRTAPNPVLMAREYLRPDSSHFDPSDDESDSPNCGAGGPPAKRARVTKHKHRLSDATALTGVEVETVKCDNLERLYAKQVLRDAMRHVIF